MRIIPDAKCNGVFFSASTGLGSKSDCDNRVCTFCASPALIAITKGFFYHINISAKMDKRVNKKIHCNIYVCIYYTWCFSVITLVNCILMCNWPDTSSPDFIGTSVYHSSCNFSSFKLARGIVTYGKLV